MHLNLDDWDHLAKVLALLGALLFFSYKAFAGYHVTNMCLRLALTRQPSVDAEQDDVAISVMLTKGDRGSVAIHDAQALLVGPNNLNLGPFQLHSIDRWTFRTTTVGTVQVKKIICGHAAKQIPYLNLTPGDEMTLSSYCQVPSTDPWRVEVVVIGRRHGPRFRFLSEQGVAQWRGSSVTLPLTPKQRFEARGPEAR